MKCSKIRRIWGGRLTVFLLTACMAGSTAVYAETEMEGPIPEPQPVYETAAEEEIVTEKTDIIRTETEDADHAESETGAAEMPEAETDEIPAEFVPDSVEPALYEAESAPVDIEPEEELLAASEELPVPDVEYCTHVQTYGWMDYVKNGELSGTTGKSKRLEGIKIRVSGVKDLGIEYRTHVQTYGWKDYVSDDRLAGTTGESKRLEAIQIRLTGTAAENYDVYYCVHVQTYGWLNWAKNDQMSGTAGYSKRLEGIRIMVLPKGSDAPAPVSGAVSAFLDKTGNSTVGANDYNVIYNTHVQTYGWQDWVGDGAAAGTSGQSKRLEGVHILLQNQDVSGSIEYRTHVQTYGWQDWVKDGALSGTTGQSKRLEAVQIRLTGEMAEKYDVWYRTHCQSYGWMGWAKNGELAGTEGYAYRMEAVEIQLLEKGSAAPGSTDTPYAKGRRLAGRIVYETTASKGKLIVLDPGHAMHVEPGSEPIAPGSGAMKAKDTFGTYGAASGPEYVLTLKVAVKLKNELVNRGYSVVLTRETSDTQISCIERAQVANAANADAFIRIHANGGGGPGVITMCTTANNPNTKAYYNKSSRLSQVLLDTYCQVTGRRNLGVVYTDDLTGNNWAKMPTTLIELGFMTVGEEDMWMASEKGQAAMVKGMADGLDKYFS